MHFQITREDVTKDHSNEIAWTNFSWKLVKGDPEEIVALGPTRSTEKDIRSQIAAAKKTMRAAGRCKVVSPGE